MAVAQLGEYEEAARPELRRYLLTSVVLALNLVCALTPAAVGVLALFGVLR